MTLVVALVSLLACLFLVSRGLPGRQWPVILAATLAIILLVVGAERAGWWPQGWRVR